jgi:flagellar FliL protein
MSETTETDTSTPAKKKGGKRKIMLIGLVAVIAVGGFFGKGMLGGSAAAEESTTTAPGPVITLSSITLNLADGHFLKLGLALQMAPPEPGAAAEEGHGAAAEDDPTRGFAPALDLAIQVFGSRNMGQLLPPEGRQAAVAELVTKLHERYHGEIEGVYLHEFVMQ